MSGKEDLEDPNLISSDQFTASNEDCSGNMPITTVAKAVTPKAIFMPKLIGSRSLFKRFAHEHGIGDSHVVVETKNRVRHSQRTPARNVHSQSG